MKKDPSSGFGSDRYNDELARNSISKQFQSEKSKVMKLSDLLTEVLHNADLPAELRNKIKAAIQQSTTT